MQNKKKKIPKIYNKEYYWSHKCRNNNKKVKYIYGAE